MTKTLTGIALLSIALSGLCFFLNQQPLNLDGILYIEVAKQFQALGLSHAMMLYPWPFYSILIAGFQNITNHNWILSGFILNALFITLAIIFYLLILLELGANSRVLYCGALLILIYPELNNLRLFIIRDAGYWAFLLGGFWQFLRFCKYPNWLNALGWSILIILATLFRIEGAVLLCLTPLILLFRTQYSWLTRLYQLLQNYAIVFILAAVLIFWHFFQGTQLQHLGRISEFINEVTSAWQMIINNFKTNQDIIAKTILVNNNGDNAGIFLGAGLLGVFLTDLITTLSLLNVILIGYAIYYRLIPRTSAVILIYFIALNLLIPLAFYAQDFIITARYLLPACLLLLLCAPFALDNLWIKVQSSTYRHRLRCIIILALSITAISGIVHFGYSKAYITSAGLWLRTNVPEESNIYSNSREVLFYAGRSTYNWPLNNNSDSVLAPLKNNGWKNYDYLAIRVNNNDDNLIKNLTTQLPMQPIQVFTNKRNDRVMIFYVPH